MTMTNHVLLMLFYAIATAVFFTFLWKTEKREQFRFFMLVFVALFVGGIVAGWLMYPFPIK